MNTLNYTNTINVADGTLIYSASKNTDKNAYSYENSKVLNQNNDIQFKLAAGIDHLRLNNGALSNSCAQYDESAVSTASTFESSAFQNSNENFINNALYKAIHEQKTDYSFVNLFI